MEEKVLPVSVTEKPSYAPPKATFVPLKLEERLLECAKTAPTLQISCVGVPQSS
jgi:hypothetical protein